eukprot:Clim_evm13s210 gene=Clim_evmTU13s210
MSPSTKTTAVSERSHSLDVANASLNNASQILHSLRSDVFRLLNHVATPLPAGEFISGVKTNVARIKQTVKKLKDAAKNVDEHRAKVNEKPPFGLTADRILGPQIVQNSQAVKGLKRKADTLASIYASITKRARHSTALSVSKSSLGSVGQTIATEPKDQSRFYRLPEPLENLPQEYFTHHALLYYFLPCCNPASYVVVMQTETQSVQPQCDAVRLRQIDANSRFRLDNRLRMIDLPRPDLVRGDPELIVTDLGHCGTLIVHLSPVFQLQIFLHHIEDKKEVQIRGLQIHSIDESSSSSGLNMGTGSRHTVFKHLTRMALVRLQELEMEAELMTDGTRPGTALSFIFNSLLVWVWSYNDLFRRKCDQCGRFFAEYDDEKKPPLVREPKNTGEGGHADGWYAFHTECI